MTSSQSLPDREHSLHDHLRSLGALSVAFSGGVDSRFLSFTALRLGLDVRMLHVKGPHIPAEESAWAESWAELNGLSLTLLSIDPLQVPEIAANGRERCYHCKNAVFRALRAEAGDLPLCDGTNASDGEGYRPGLRALRELGIISPLAAAGLRKVDIRALARKNGMDMPDQSAHPCLFTRYNYGIRPTYASLAALNTAEEAVGLVLRRHAVLTRGADAEDPQAERGRFRLRFEQEGQAVLHVAYADLTDAVLAALRGVLAETGFSDVPVVTVEQISGHFDNLPSAG
ncbi:hypothetical protein AGMMS49974_02430 [Deltaproteobacteria bacterium]|nr:hypothetical protein AGMMS49974_02430 [Deltaproteobacteria bacterium]